jgi:5-methylcytosine-specific restriction endonuclease McrA
VSVSPLEKICLKCGQPKPITAFVRPGRSCVTMRCDACIKDQDREYQRSYYQKHRNRLIAATASWTAKNRERSNAHKRASARRNPRPYDQKERAWTQAWADQHPEQTREYARNWARRNPEVLRFHAARRRARKRGAEGDHTLLEWQALCAEYGHRCLACGCSGMLLTQDHVVPLSRGGSDYISNIQPLCRSCNLRKGTKTIDYRLRA